VWNAVIHDIKNKVKFRWQVAWQYMQHWVVRKLNKPIFSKAKLIKSCNFKSFKKNWLPTIFFRNNTTKIL